MLSGVPQGSVLGPLLFLLLIGDIDEGLLIAILSSFADDTRMMSPARTLHQMSKFQEDLDTVFEWAKTNKMEFNNTKFELMRYCLFDDDLKECTNYVSNSGSTSTLHWTPALK